MANGNYNGYLLSDNSVSMLKSLFVPKYARAILHHVTYSVGRNLSSPPTITSCEVIGYADTGADEDGHGLECLVVSLDGNHVRPDGGTYHITLSLSPEKYSPKDSNELLKTGFSRLARPISIEVTVLNA